MAIRIHTSQAQIEEGRQLLSGAKRTKKKVPQKTKEAQLPKTWHERIMEDDE
jgi:hypothetical protein